MSFEAFSYVSVQFVSGAVINANQRIDNLAVAYGSKNIWVIASASATEPAASLPIGVYSY